MIKNSANCQTWDKDRLKVGNGNIHEARNTPEEMRALDQYWVDAVNERDFEKIGFAEHGYEDVIYHEKVGDKGLNKHWTITLFGKEVCLFSCDDTRLNLGKLVKHTINVDIFSSDIDREKYRTSASKRAKIAHNVIRNGETLYIDKDGNMRKKGSNGWISYDIPADSKFG